MQTIQTTENITVIKCYLCGIAFGVPESFRRERLEDKRLFSCPNGHEQGYVESEADKLRKQLAQERESTEQARRNISYWQDRERRTELRLRATRGVVTRTKNRISKGVCPCCNRQFKDLHGHMTTKHPNYTKAE